LKFDRNCYFEGIKNYAFNESLTAKLKSRDLYGYNSVLLNYRIEKVQKDSNIFIQSTYGESYIENDKGERITFHGVFSVRLVPREVQSSAGTSGIYLEKLNVDITNFHGKKISYQKSIQ